MSRLRLKDAGSFPTGYEPPAWRRKGVASTKSIEMIPDAGLGAVRPIRPKGQSSTRVWETMDYDAAERVAELIAVRAGGETEEPLSRLRQDKDGAWRFKLGQCISHQSQSMPSLVMGRVRTSKGREIYGVRSFMNVDPNRDRTILADSLVDVVPGSLPCHDCLLHQTGLCPAR